MVTLYEIAMKCNIMFVIVGKNGIKGWKAGLWGLRMASYSDVMKVLAALYGADEKVIRGPLRGRVQNLQKMGIPIGLQVGKGKKIDYKREQIYQIVLCMELAEIGVIPSKLSDIIKKHWNSISSILWREIQGQEEGSENLLVFKMNQMSSAWGNDGAFEMHSSYDNAHLIRTLKGFRGWRHLYLVNITEVVRKVEQQLAIIVPQQEG